MFSRIGKGVGGGVAAAGVVFGRTAVSLNGCVFFCGDGVCGNGVIAGGWVDFFRSVGVSADTVEDVVSAGAVVGVGRGVAVGDSC